MTERSVIHYPVQRRRDVTVQRVGYAVVVHCDGAALTPAQAEALAQTVLLLAAEARRP